MQWSSLEGRRRGEWRRKRRKKRVGPMGAKSTYGLCAAESKKRKAFPSQCDFFVALLIPNGPPTDTSPLRRSFLRCARRPHSVVFNVKISAPASRFLRRTTLSPALPSRLVSRHPPVLSPILSRWIKATSFAGASEQDFNKK